MRLLHMLQYIMLASISHATLTPTTTIRMVLTRRDGEPPVTTVGLPSNGHQIGDVIIYVSEADNKALDQIISQNVCPDSKLRKRFVSDCFFRNGAVIYSSMRNGGMPGLVDMANSGFELPIPPPELDAGVVTQFDQMGGYVPGLNQQARGRLGRIVWWAQYPALLAHVPSNNPIKVIPAFVATRVAPAPPATSSARCHYRDRIPYCVNCGGLAGNPDRETCLGFGDLWKFCPCLKNTPFPPPKDHYNLDPTFLRTILEGWKNNPKVTCLGSNATQDISEWAKLAHKACENADLSRIMLREGMTTADLGDGSRDSPYQRYKYMFRWDPVVDQRCSYSCEEIFNTLLTCGDNSKSVLAKTGASKFSCGTAAYKIEDNAPIKVTCRGKSAQAPRGDKESNGATSLDKAIKQFCTDNDGKVVRKGENVYQRYGITDFDVPDRSSFWLRGAITCGQEGLMKKSDCMESLNNAMEQCDPNTGYSHGLAASIGCLDYSIDLSGVTWDDSPPWDQKVRFPPPEDAERPDGGQHEIMCSHRGFMVEEKSLSDEELTSAIDKLCQNGAEIPGFGTRKPWLDKMFAWPSGDNPRFLVGAILNGEGSGVVNDKPNWTPYKDMQWCDNYDWKMGKDDCTYAIRKMHRTCTHGKTLQQADYTYRCVRYSYAYPKIDN